MRGYPVAYFLFAVVCCGCSFKLELGNGTSFDDSGASGDTGTSGGTGATGGWQVSLLPTPPGYVPPAYTPEQQARYDEVDPYLVNGPWAGYSILAATQGYSGDIYYWVDDNTLPPAYQTAPSWTAEDLIPADGTTLGRTELEL